MKIIVDKIEGEVATIELEDGEMLNIPYMILDGAKEGDIVEIKICKEETEKRKATLGKLLDKLLE